MRFASAFIRRRSSSQRQDHPPQQQQQQRQDQPPQQQLPPSDPMDDEKAPTGARDCDRARGDVAAESERKLLKDAAASKGSGRSKGKGKGGADSDAPRAGRGGWDDGGRGGGRLAYRDR